LVDYYERKDTCFTVYQNGVGAGNNRQCDCEEKEDEKGEKDEKREKETESKMDATL